MISIILVATDGSETAMKSVDYASDLAKQLGAAVTLLTVIDMSSLLSKAIPGRATPTHLVEPVEDYLRQIAGAVVEEAQNLCRGKGVRSEKVIRSGDAVEEILWEAEKSKADLIVMGSHGRSALKAAVLGSVAFGVIHKDTKFPVLVVRR